MKADKSLLRVDNIVWERPHPKDENGFQIVYGFKNGYGLSVVRFSWDISKDPFAVMGQMFGNLFGQDLHFNRSIGYENDLWEVAFVKFVDERNSFELLGVDLFDFEEVKGNLTEQEVNEILEKIEKNEFQVYEDDCILN